MALEALAGTVKTFQDDNKGKKDDVAATSLEPKDFFWDQFLKYISSAILALTVLNVSVEFLRGGGVQCFPPAISNFLTGAGADELNRDFTIRQSDYLNNYCSDSIPSSEYFPIYILVQGILLIAPHFIWSAVFKGDFDSFFAVTEKLDRLRDRKTGKYDSTNFDRVEKLELEFGSKRKRIFLGYIAKLCLQLAVCIGTIIFSETFFNDFSYTFQCPTGIKNNMGFPENWPLNTTIPCVFASLRVLNLIRYGDYILTGMAMILIVVGLVWCAIRHTKELGHLDIAEFVFQSCLTTKTHVFPRILEVRRRAYHTDTCWHCMFPFALCCYCCKGCILCSFQFMLFMPHIRNDLDFLQMTLFRADSSHGRVFKEILIDKELQKLHGKDHQLIHLFLNVQLDMAALIDKKKRAKALQCDDGTDDNDGEIGQALQQLPREIDMRHFFRMSGFSGNPEKYAFTHYQSLLGNTEWRPVEGIRDRLYGFVKFCPKYTKGEYKGEVKTDMAMDISFGSSGYALVLARAFKTVVSVNFRPFFRNETNPVKKEKFYTNYINVDFPDNIFTRGSDTINEAVRQMVEPMFEDKKRPVDFIVVGPFEDDTKRVTVTLEIEMLYSVEIIEEEAILLAIRPLQIGHRKTTERFLKYEPPVQLFDHTYHEKTVLPCLRAEVGPDFREVDGCTGITVKCGDTICIFEFIAYKYIGETEKVEEPETFTLADLMEQQSNDDPPNNEAGDQHPPVFIGRSQSMPINAQPSETDQDTPPVISPPLTRPLEPGRVYDFGGTQHPQLQRQNTLPPQLQQQGTFDFSPQARELKQRQMLKSARAFNRSASVQSPNNNQPVESSSSGLRDSNRQRYTPESTATPGDGQRRDNSTTGASKPQQASELQQASASTGPNTVDMHWSKQRTSTVRPASSPLSQGSGGPGSQRATSAQRRSLSSGKSPLLSIDEDGATDESESSLTSPS